MDSARVHITIRLQYWTPGGARGTLRNGECLPDTNTRHKVIQNRSDISRSREGGAKPVCHKRWTFSMRGHPVAAREGARRTRTLVD